MLLKHDLYVNKILILFSIMQNISHSYTIYVVESIKCVKANTCHNLSKLMQMTPPLWQKVKKN